MAFEEFALRWGDVASVVGLAVALVGFTLTLFGIKRSVSASKAARQAARDARAAISRKATFVSISSAIAQMEEIRRLHHNPRWANLLERYPSARKALIEIRSQHGEMEPKHQNRIDRTVARFRTLEEDVDRHVKQGAPEPDLTKFNRTLSFQIDALHELQNTTENEANLQ